MLFADISDYDVGLYNISVDLYAQGVRLQFRLIISLITSSWLCTPFRLWDFFRCRKHAYPPILTEVIRLIIKLKAYCVGGSMCRALLLYAVKLTKARAILISPWMWLGNNRIIVLPSRFCAMSFDIEAMSKAISVYVQTH